jgi:hypothetical protein
MGLLPAYPEISERQRLMLDRIRMTLVAGFTDVLLSIWSYRHIRLFSRKNA